MYIPVNVCVFVCLLHFLLVCLCTCKGGVVHGIGHNNEEI